MTIVATKLLRLRVNTRSNLRLFHCANKPLTMSLPYAPRSAYYDGKLQSGSSTSTFQTIDPATAQPVANIHTTSNAGIDAAIA